MNQVFAIKFFTLLSASIVGERARMVELCCARNQ